MIYSHLKLSKLESTLPPGKEINHYIGQGQRNEHQMRMNMDKGDLLHS